MPAQQSNFPHRHNKDGSSGSICLICFQTVATEFDEHALAWAERGHVCDPAEIFAPCPLETAECLDALS